MDVAESGDSSFPFLDFQLAEVPNHYLRLEQLNRSLASARGKDQQFSVLIFQAFVVHSQWKIESAEK